MANPFFRFKQFTVYHDRCAMKVGTDGVLLGAWADCSQAKTILDVGTGSGLIALMLAQRSSAKIDAIDVNQNAYEQAAVNFRHSPFDSRLTAFHSALQTFEPTGKYDLIVSNPPYFSNSLRCPDSDRSDARHADTLSLEVLIDCSAAMLSDIGTISLIIPVEQFESLKAAAYFNGLFLSRETLVYPKPDGLAKRVLAEFSRERKPFRKEELILEISRHVYSEKWKELTNDFYLNL